VQRVLDDIPVALLVARTDGSAASVNRAWCRAVGLAPAEALGHGWLGVVGPADRARLLTALRQVAGDGSPADRGAGTSYDGCCVELDVAVGDRRTRWRLARDECGTVVVAVVDAGPALLTTSDGTAGVPDWLIPELFEVGLDLASCVSTLPEPARARVAAAMGGIDRVIARLRRSTRAGRRDFS
jgi:PAS domain S-box-containing protein